MRRSRIVPCVLFAVLCGAISAPRAQSTSGRNAPELAGFKTRVNQYAELSRRLEATLPKLPTEATPEAIDRNQRAFETLIVASRPKARAGDVFTPTGQSYIRALMKRVFAGADRDRLLGTILDENPGPVPLTVNGRYPADAPLASMPPEVLAALPELPKELEYRFVGRALILLDPHAHIVVDLVPAALPQ